MKNLDSMRQITVEELGQLSSATLFLTAFPDPRNVTRYRIMSAGVTTGMSGSGNSQMLIERANDLSDKQGAIFLLPRDEELAAMLSACFRARYEMDIVDLPNSLQTLCTQIDKHLSFSRG